jgi:hypothetical protein
MLLGCRERGRRSGLVGIEIQTGNPRWQRVHDGKKHKEDVEGRGRRYGVDGERKEESRKPAETGCGGLALVLVLQ